MDSIPSVQPGAAALAFGAGVLTALALGLLLARLTRRSLAPSAQALLASVADGLGDAALLLDVDGVVVSGNAEAARLAGVAEARLPGAKAATLLGDDLAVLQRGARRGPSSARVTLLGKAGPLRAQAVVARISTRPARDLAVLRPEAPEPTTLAAPAATPPPLPPARAAARLDLAAVASALREPAGRAATAAAMLRLLAPSLPPRTESELARLEIALAELERRLGALAAAGAGARGEVRAANLGALLLEAVSGLPGARGRLRTTAPPVEALVDPARLRAALREIVRAALDALPAGGEVVVSVARRGEHAAVEIASPAAGAAGEGTTAAVARALLGPEGGRVEVEVTPGRGRLCRIALPGVRAGVTTSAGGAHATPPFL